MQKFTTGISTFFPSFPNSRKLDLWYRYLILVLGLLHRNMKMNMLPEGAQLVLLIKVSCFCSPPLFCQTERGSSRRLIVSGTQGHLWLRCCGLLAAAAAASVVLCWPLHTWPPPPHIRTRLAAHQLHHPPITSAALGACEGEGGGTTSLNSPLGGRGWREEEPNLKRGGAEPEKRRSRAWREEEPRNLPPHHRVCCSLSAATTVIQPMLAELRFALTSWLTGATPLMLCRKVT